MPSGHSKLPRLLICSYIFLDHSTFCELCTVIVCSLLCLQYFEYIAHYAFNMSVFWKVYMISPYFKWCVVTSCSGFSSLYRILLFVHGGMIIIVSYNFFKRTFKMLLEACEYHFYVISEKPCIAESCLELLGSQQTTN